jgi:hypothetical protein
MAMDVVGEVTSTLASIEEIIRRPFPGDLDAEDFINQRISWALMRLGGQDPMARIGTEAYNRLKAMMMRRTPTGNQTTANQSNTDMHWGTWGTTGPRKKEQQ